MFDLQLLRRISVIASMSEQELEGARSHREAAGEVEAQLESLEATRGPQLTGEQIAALISQEAKLLEHFPPDLGRYPYPAWRK